MNYDCWNFLCDRSCYFPSSYTERISCNWTNKIFLTNGLRVIYFWLMHFIYLLKPFTCTEIVNGRCFMFPSKTTFVVFTLMRVVGLNVSKMISAKFINCLLNFPEIRNTILNKIFHIVYYVILPIPLNNQYIFFSCNSDRKMVMWTFLVMTDQLLKCYRFIH